MYFQLRISCGLLFSVQYSICECVWCVHKDFVHKTKNHEICQNFNHATFPIHCSQFSYFSSSKSLKSSSSAGGGKEIGKLRAEVVNYCVIWIFSYFMITHLINKLFVCLWLVYEETKLETWYFERNAGQICGYWQSFCHHSAIIPVPVQNKHNQMIKESCKTF